MRKTKVIAFANNKGGSGKTTTCSNIACAMAMDGKRVLMIDGDMQLNLTISYFDEERALAYAKNGKNICEAVKGARICPAFIISTEFEGLDMVPSSPSMSGIEFELFSKPKRDFVLSECLKPVSEKGIYDYILIDAPPMLGCWVTNVLCASDFVVIPVEASPWGLFGLANMFEFCKRAKRPSHETEILGIAVTKADERKKYFKQTMETLKGLGEIRLFENYIRVDSAIEWSQDNSKPVIAYKKTSRSAVEYKNLAKEIMKYADR